MSTKELQYVFPTGTFFLGFVNMCLFLSLKKGLGLTDDEAKQYHSMIPPEFHNKQLEIARVLPMLRTMASHKIVYIRFWIFRFGCQLKKAFEFGSPQWRRVDILCSHSHYEPFVPEGTPITRGMIDVVAREKTRAPRKIDLDSKLTPSQIKAMDLVDVPRKTPDADLNLAKAMSESLQMQSDTESKMPDDNMNLAKAMSESLQMQSDAKSKTSDYDMNLAKAMSESLQMQSDQSRPTVLDSVSEEDQLAIALVLSREE